MRVLQVTDFLDLHLVEGARELGGIAFVIRALASFRRAPPL